MHVPKATDADVRAGAEGPSQPTSGASRPAPSLETLTERNIESILCLEDKERAAKPRLYKMVSAVAAFCGTVAFLWANLAVFAIWIALNESIVKFDPYPFTFLLFIVSLEAIFLSVLILISQNMAAEENERRHHLDLQINLLNEREMTALLRLVTRMATKLGVEGEDQREVRTLTEDTNPSEVLHQIVRAESAHNR
ncbi:DUF1003 domain-containing protein [Variovorax sp. J22P271]|uniref:DUF1003 domain-containing protein n=1 Tax=Variovorax davisae TaxID=3053515 RepID=UPI002575CD0D|nr:DUF1003 domain-containing protein [Variovorax sp. J22P271]MDM0032275.1 DUF1003 domain-containing protein [Variovorax sp. J22P271]